MSAIGHLADIPVTLSNVRFWGVKPTSTSAEPMSAFDPKRTLTAIPVL
jgi:hypothetical protein